MLNFLNADAVVRELSLRVQDAWGIAPEKIYDYSPLQPQSGECVVIQADSASKVVGSAQCYTARQDFTISAKWPYPTSGNLTLTSFKTEKANQLLTEIYKARRFTDGTDSLADLFGLTSISFDETGDDHARFLELTAKFFTQTPNTSMFN